jgi:recombination protein RecA
VEAGIVDKSGAWFAFGSERLGQGKENVRQYLQENPDLAAQIRDKLMEHLGVNGLPQTKGAAAAEDETENPGDFDE